jgi:hypothetical protein
VAAALGAVLVYTRIEEMMTLDRGTTTVPVGVGEWSTTGTSPTTDSPEIRLAGTMDAPPSRCRHRRIVRSGRPPAAFEIRQSNSW